MDTSHTTYADIAYGPHARALQAEVGADNRIVDPGTEPFVLDGRDRRQIREADMFFLATVTDSGWPYVQHKGGPAGFVHVLDDRTIAFADFPGNQQFVTAGNLDRDGRVCLFFVDFPTRRRIKVFGHARLVEAADDPQLVDLTRLIERGEQRLTVVARASGLGSTANLRTQLRRHTGLTPSEYRQRFGPAADPT